MKNRKGIAPGKSFREGLSLVDLFRMFPDEATACVWLETARWGQAGQPTHCPICACTGKIKAVPSAKPLPYWCGDCRRHFSVRTGTVMHRSKIDLQKWVIAIFLWSTSLKGVSSMKLHRDLGITQKSAYFMAQRLREAWSNGTGPMNGPVEVDEAYFGGRRKNMHRAKREKLAGRGGAGKTAVVGAKDRHSNEVSARVVAHTDRPTLHGFVDEHAKPGATVYTDEASAYRGLRNVDHEAVKHSVGEYVRGMAHTNGIESFWAALRRGYLGTFHKLSPKHLQRYVSEFATRHNLRDHDTIDMMAETVARMEGKRLTYDRLKAPNGLPSGARGA